VQVRHRSPPTHARIRLSAGRARVELERDIGAVSPGQAAVVYDGAQVLGGGWIAGPK
jgi:tRNA-specific 2-thiouridylase